MYAHISPAHRALALASYACTDLALASVGDVDGITDPTCKRLCALIGLDDRLTGESLAFMLIDAEQVTSFLREVYLMVSEHAPSEQAAVDRFNLASDALYDACKLLAGLDDEECSALFAAVHG